MSKIKSFFIGFSLICLFALPFVFTPALFGGIPERKQQYVTLYFQTWTYSTLMPYGQGFDAVDTYQNSSGSWVRIAFIDADSGGVYQVPVDCSIKLLTYAWMNSTLTGASSGANGWNYVSCNCTVKNSTGDVVFNIYPNMTHDSVDTGIDPPLWLYGWEDILNFKTAYGQTYNVTISFFVFW